MNDKELKEKRKGFLEITKRIGNAYKDPFTEGQFEEWFREFGDEDYQVVDKAVTRMVGEYKFFPMIATLREYIKKIKLDEQEKEDPVDYSSVGTHKPPAWFMGMGRFLSWLQANQISCQGWSTDKLKAEKARFEKEHPEWKSKKLGRGMASIGEIIGDSLPE